MNESSGHQDFNASQKEIWKILISLKEGIPIPMEMAHKHGIIQRGSPEQTNFKNNLFKGVKNSAWRPPIGQFTCYWIVGEPGSGKTQLMLTLYKEIKDLNRKDTIVSFIDLKRDQYSPTIQGIQGGILLGSTLGSKSLFDEFRPTAEALLKSVNRLSRDTGLAIDDSREIIELIALGLSVFKSLELCTLSTPFLGRIIGGMLRHTLYSRPLIKKQLIFKNKEWKLDNEVLNLMANWLYFCSNPTQENLKYLRSEVMREGMLDSFMKILKLNKISTLVLFLDELGSLGDSLFSVLSMIKGKEVNSSDEKVNIHLICAAYPDIETRIKFDSEAESYGRRFWDERTVFRTQNPSLNNSPNDDLSNLIDSASCLITKLDSQDFKFEFKEQDEQELRVALTHQEPTWDKLWKKILSKIAPWL
jgi:hypothetical protein